MFTTILVFIVVIVSVINSANGSLAPFITKCKWDDSKCIKDTAQTTIPLFAAGIPELGVEVLDPFQMKSLDASSAGLTLYLTDTTITGLKGCRANKVERDVPKSKMLVELICNVDVLGQYEISGKLLVLPIEGKGKIHVVLRKLVINVDGDVDEIVGKDGAKHFIVKNWTHSYSLQDQATLELDNLFNGNEALATAVRELISNSSKEIVTEVGPPIIKAVATKIIDNIKNFFLKVPVEDLAL